MRFKPRPYPRSWELRSLRRWPPGEKVWRRSRKISRLDPPSSISITYPEAIEGGLSRITPLLPEASISKRSLALMLLSGDESLAEWLHQNLSEKEILQIEKIRQEIQIHFADPIGYLINQARLRKVDELLSQVMGLRGEAPKTISSLFGKPFDSPHLGDPHSSVRPLDHL